MSDVDPSRPWAWSWHMLDRGVLPKIFGQTTEHGQCCCCSMAATSAACSAVWTIKTARPPLELGVQELINEVPKHYRDEMTVNENDPCASAYMSTSFKNIKRMSNSLFVLQVHHGGYFVGSPKIYLGGKFDCITNVDSDLMSYFEILGLMKELGIELENANMYHKMPDCDLDGGLREIKTDRDVVDMFAIHSGRSTLAVYVENIGVPLEVEEVVIVSAEKEVVIMSVEEKEDDGSESEKDGSECSERSINLSDLESFADGDEIFDSAKRNLTSNLLANECVNGKWEVGSGSGSGTGNGQHYFSDDIVIEVDEVEYEDWNTPMESLDGYRTGQFTEFFEDMDMERPQLEVGMLFANVGVFRAALRKHVIQNGTEFTFLMCDTLSKNQQSSVASFDNGKGVVSATNKGKGIASGDPIPGCGRGSGRGLGRRNGRGNPAPAQMQRKSTTYGDVYFSSGVGNTSSPNTAAILDKFGPSQGSSNMPPTQQASQVNNSNSLEGYAAF